MKKAIKVFKHFFIGIVSLIIFKTWHVVLYKFIYRKVLNKIIKSNGVIALSSEEAIERYAKWWELSPLLY